jgi:hypothetical protein
MGPTLLSINQLLRGSAGPGRLSTHPGAVLRIATWGAGWLAYRIYDTTYWSQSNAGDTFGDHLTDAERRAVIEYLKTL